MSKTRSFYLIVLILVSLYLYRDYQGPDVIHFEKSDLFGFEANRAEDLMVQTYDDAGNLWASRGMVIYCKTQGDSAFRRIGHAPTGLTWFWLRNFSLVRKLTLRPECIELSVSPCGHLAVMSAGHIWVRKKGEDEFRKTHTLRHYGKGDQGVFNNGLLFYNDSTVYYGEYHQNRKGGEICIFEGSQSGFTWTARHVFPSGMVRHLHAIQKDPYTKDLWVCSGDNDRESHIGYSRDGFKTIQYIGKGSQQFCATQLTFTNQYVYWGSDPNDSTVLGLYRYNKQNGVTEKLFRVEGCVFYTTTLLDGTVVCTTNREATVHEKDLYSRMAVLWPDGRYRTYRCGEWNKRSGFFKQYSKLRLPRQSYPDTSLYVTVLKHKGIDDNTLYEIPEHSLKTP